MKLIKLSLAALAGGVAANYLLRKGGAANAAGRFEEGSTASPDGQAASGPQADSPNQAERMLAARPANSLVGSGAESLDPLRSNARDGELARSTGLSDFARGA
jgi:hypothetical protein